MNTKHAKNRSCAFTGCGRTAGTKNLCDTHYRQKRTKGVMTPIGSHGGHRERPALARLQAKVLVGGVPYHAAPSAARKRRCWDWSGSVNSNGYGQFRYNGSTTSTHRASYEMHVGPIGDETVHHKCSNPLCCNPGHLELATHRENLAEMFARKAFEKKTLRLERENARLVASLERARTRNSELLAELASARRRRRY